MAVRRRGKSWSVEVYDGTRKSGKRYVGTFDSQREAKDAERSALTVTGRRRRQPSVETVASFADRWLELCPRQKEATNIAYREQIKPFVERYGALTLDSVDVPLAMEWMGEKRWTLNGLRAMYSDARRMGLVDANPFAGLRLRGTHGRRDIDVLSLAEVERLADCVGEVWSGEVALTVRALVLMAAFVGMRPAEMYGLRWSDIDFPNDEIHVRRQYSPKARALELPKNGEERTIVLTRPAREGLVALPRPVDSESVVFRASKGGSMSGRVQHYYWHPVRCRFGRPGMDLYELRHFCASWLFNDLQLPAQDVAHQLGHTDGGALVQRLYGHPSASLARQRIKQRAVRGSGPQVVPLSEADQRQGQR